MPSTNTRMTYAAMARSSSSLPSGTSTTYATTVARSVSPSLPLPPSSEASNSTSAPSTSLPTPPSSAPVSPAKAIRPAPGTIKFGRKGVIPFTHGDKNGGDPTNHPWLVLPTCHKKFNPSTHVDILFLTSQDIIGKTRTKKWAAPYVPLGSKTHPFRESLPLAPGCASLKSPSCINIDTVYTVPLSSLVDIELAAGAVGAPPSLTPETMDRVMQYVDNPRADLNLPWTKAGLTCEAARKESFQRERLAAARTAPAASATPAVKPTPATAAPATQAPVPKRGLSPTAVAFEPGRSQPKRQQRPCDIATSWR